MDRCSICNGRVILAPEGPRCMNPRCEGAKGLQKDAEGVSCQKCGEQMHYRGMDSWGQPSYACSACGTNVKL